jgi:hypothetical protein
MAILRPLVQPTSGIPNVIMLPRGKNMTQEEYYTQQKTNPVDASFNAQKAAEGQDPQNPQYSQEPQSGNYIAQQLQNYANRKAPPMLEPSARVRNTDTSLSDSGQFQGYYDQLNQITDIGNQASAASSARAAYRRQQAMAAAASSNGGGGSVGAGPTGQYTGQYGKGVDQWRDTTLQVMHELGIPDNYLDAIMRRMKQESGGNPNAINNWDSNAAKGTPSQGLMQTIPGTFAAYAGKYASRGIYDPYANIYAGLSYAGNRYGKSHGGFLGGVYYAMNKPGGY